MADIRQCLQGFPVDTHISTITVNVNLSDTVNLQNIKDRFFDSTVQEYVTSVMEGLEFHPENKKNFNNSLVFKLKSSDDKKHRKAIKVFCNGSLHITGYNDIATSMYMADVFRTFLEIVEGGTGFQDWYTISGYQIQTINICYNLGIGPSKNINLRKLADILRSKCSYYVSFNTDLYVGLVIKAPHLQVLIFESGSIILTCVKNAEEINEGFRFSYEMLQSVQSDILVEKILHQKSKKKRCREDDEFDYSKYLILK